MSIWKKLFSKSEQQPTRNLGRNELCWCGSGMKYKKCHLASDEQKRSRIRAAICPPSG